MGINADIAGLAVGDDQPVRIMGVINVSPESFYKGSVKTSEDSLIQTVKEFVKSGVDIIDIGARSTAPYLETYIPIEDEIKRAVWAVKTIAENIDVLISIDTMYGKVAEAAIKAGAHIVNDVSGLKADPYLGTIIKEYDVPYIIVAHKESVNEPANPMKEVLDALRESFEIIHKYGIDPDKSVIDPGIGFFRTKQPPWYEWDSKILANLHKLRVFNRPILVGVSRKSFIGKITGKSSPEDRLWGSLAATAIAVMNGAHIIRTHDVKETLDVVKISEYIRKFRENTSFSN